MTPLNSVLGKHTQISHRDSKIQINFVAQLEITFKEPACHYIYSQELAFFSVYQKHKYSEKEKKRKK